MTKVSVMTLSSIRLNRAWISLLGYLLSLSLIGVVAIPNGEDIVIRWSWGDWTPVDSVTKLWGLSLVPLVAALVAFVSITRRRAAGLEFVAAPFVWAEILAIAVLAVAHSVIVFAAI